MILVTGGTGFVGRRLVARLARDEGLRVRVLLSSKSDPSQLPQDAPLDFAVGHIADPKTMSAAMEGIHTVFHLVGTETRGRHAHLDSVDIAGARAVIDAAHEAKVGRIIYVSRLGADRASAYRTLRSKGEIEEAIRSSGLSFTIFQTGVLFGEGDRFSEHIAMLARSFPIYFVPGDGETVLQPLWVEDLVTCLAMSLEDLDLLDQSLTLGGPELLSYRRIVMRAMYAAKVVRPIVGVPFLMARWGAWFLDGLFSRWPYTEQWSEMLASNQTADLGAIERTFGFRPAAFDVGLIDTYLHKLGHFRLLRYIWSSRRW
jgi:NADH dehydrogenase